MKKNWLTIAIITISAVFLLIVILLVINNNTSENSVENKGDLINLSYKETKIKTGEKLNLEASYKNEYGYYSYLVYESLDPTIVKVEKNTGNIIGVKEGTTKVKVYVEVSPDIYTYCDVTVEGKIVEEEPKNEPINNNTNNNNNTNTNTNDNNNNNNNQNQNNNNNNSNSNENQGTKANETSKSNTVYVQNITLNKSSLSLYVGKNEKIGFTISPSNATNKKVIWKSSNSNVASVDTDGNVHGVSVGFTTITAVSADGNYTISIPVTIINPTTSVTGVTLNKSNITLVVGQTDSVTATVSPNNASNKSLEFSSSNSNIASVDNNGNIKAISQGEATITVTTFDQGKKAIATVSVKEPIKVSKVEFSEKLLTLMPDESFKIDVKVSPSNATDKTLVWTSNPAVASVDSNGNVKAINEGITDINAQSKDSVGSSSPVMGKLSLRVLPKKGDVVFEGDFPSGSVKNTGYYSEVTGYTCKAGKEYGLLVKAEGWTGSSQSGNLRFATVKSYKSSDTSIVSIKRHPNVQPDCINCTLTLVECKKKGTVNITATNSLGGTGKIKITVK